MVQVGNNKSQIGGRELIQESDHLSEMVQRQNVDGQNRQVEQGSSQNRKQAKQDFNYENPRQVQ